VADRELEPGLYEALVTRALVRRLARLDASRVEPERRTLRDDEAADRVARHVGELVVRAIEAEPDASRAETAAAIADALVARLAMTATSVDSDEDVPLRPAEVLAAILRRRPDGSAAALEMPLTPLLDTTVLTNSPGEPAVVHELRAEVDSADAIDVVMAFVRWSGIRPFMEVHRRHCEAGKPLRIVTTTYTNSTELRALEELVSLGAAVKVSYDTASTRLHAKAWVFHRRSGYSTAYVGSSNLTHSAMVNGLEWNVRVSGVRNPDVVAKMSAVFDAYWASDDFRTFDAEEFRRRTNLTAPDQTLLLSPVEVVLQPFQERLLEQIEVSRSMGRHRNLLVAATGTGKTVMAAVDYARLRARLERSRLLFVAHREEILDQGRRTFAHALRDAAFGELWVGGRTPERFQHVFASIQSVTASGLAAMVPDHFDVVIIDEVPSCGRAVVPRAAGACCAA
jgi:HKD family nuclease